jgi:hypothetical protein
MTPRESSKSEMSQKPEIPMTETAAIAIPDRSFESLKVTPSAAGFEFLFFFVLRICFVFRISDFEFQHR